MIKLPLLPRILAMSCLLFLIVTCKKENDDSKSSDSPSVTTSGSTVKTTLCGMVTDETGQPIANVLVSTNTQSTTTNSNGIFTLANADVSVKRCIIAFSKGGYLKAIQATVPHKNNVTYFQVSMFADVVTHTIDASIGGTLTLASGASIQFLYKHCHPF